MADESKGRSALIILLCLVSIVVLATRFKMSTDLSLFLPEPNSKIEQLLRHQLDNGASTSMLFVALQGAPAKQLSSASQRLRTQLAQTGYFHKISNSAGDFNADQLAVIVDNRYQLSHSNLSESFSEQGLKAALQDRLRGLSSPQASLEKKFLRKDPTGEVIHLLSDWQGKLSKHKTPKQLHGVWFSEDQKRTLLLAELQADITSLEQQTLVIRSIKDAFVQLNEPEMQMILTGPAAFAVESGEDIKADVRFLTYLAVAMVVLFLWMAFGSLPVVLLVVAPLAVGVLIATALIVLWNGQIHGITLAFGVTLAGVAVDYPIHLLTGLGPDKQENTRHIKRIWPTLRLGVLSTIVAYAAFLVSGFGGLVQLGLFTITGLSAAALFSRYVLPYLVRRKTAKVRGLIGLHSGLKSIAQNLAKIRLMVPFALLAGLLALLVTDLPVMHLNVDSLSPIKDTRRAEGRMLRGDLGFWSGGKMMVVTGANKEQVLQTSEMIEASMSDMITRGVINGFDMAAQFLPSLAKQEKNLAVLNNVPAIRQALQTAMTDTPFKPAVFNPFLESIEAPENRIPMDAEALAKTAVGDKLKPLLFDFNDEAGGVVLLHGVTDELALKSFADDYADVYYLNLKSEATQLVAKSVNWVALVMLGCIALIYLMLAKSFGSWVRPFRIMVPTFSAAVVVAAVLVYVGCPLSIFHLISLLLVVGLGLDYALFFNRLPDHPEEWETTFKSLWICGATTVLVFGILTFSQTPPLRAIGLTVGIGAFISLIFAAMWSASTPKQNTSDNS